MSRTKNCYTALGCLLQVQHGNTRSTHDNAHLRLHEGHLFVKR